MFTCVPCIRRSDMKSALGCVYLIVKAPFFCVNVSTNFVSTYEYAESQHHCPRKRLL